MAEKSPAFQFYPRDFLTDEKVALMNLSEVGAYTLLLCHAWLEGSIPDDPLAAAKLCRVPVAQMKRSWPKVRDCWQPSEDGRLRNPRQEEERVKQSRFRDVAPILGRSGGNAKWGNNPDVVNRQKRHERLTEARRRGAHTPDEWRELLEALNYSCARCGSADNIQKDHVRLIRNGGSDHISNLQPLCRRCNSAKGPDETDHVPFDIRQWLCHFSPGDTVCKQLDEQVGKNMISPSSSSSFASSSSTDPEASVTDSTVLGSIGELPPALIPLRESLRAHGEAIGREPDVELIRKIAEASQNQPLTAASCIGKTWHRRFSPQAVHRQPVPESLAYWVTVIREEAAGGWRS